MTVGELLKRISSRELTEWRTYFALEPFGEDRADFRAGIVASTMANVFRKSGTKPYKAQDFMPKFGKEKQGWREQLELVKAMNAVLGGKHGDDRQPDSESDGKNGQL